MKDKISVVVPVYNVKKYIKECLDSIIAQTYTNLEIIVVDDGSTDGSSSICEEYSKKDSRIKVVHQKNRGAANAKNVALCIASGDYLAFVDSDDFLEPDAYEYMMLRLRETEADVIQCSFREIFISKTKEYIVTDTSKEYDTIAYLKKFTTEWTSGLLWDKLYKRKLFEHILFEEGHKIDDEFFTYRGILNAKKIIVDSKIIYNYRKRKSSVMSMESSREKILFDKLCYLEKRKEDVLRSFPELRGEYENHYLNMLLILAKDPDITEESLAMIKELVKSFWKNPHAQVSFRLSMKLKKLQYQRIDTLLKHKGKRVLDPNIKLYFE